MDIPFDKIRDPYGKFQYPENKGRDGCRTPILWNDNANEGFGFTKSSEAWLPFGNEAQKKSVLVQDQDDESILAFTKKMIQLRKATKSLSQNADLKFIHADDQILIFGFTSQRFCIVRNGLQIRQNSRERTTAELVK